MKKLAIIVFLTFTASFTPIAARFAVTEISPLSLAFFRFGIATILFIFLFFHRHLNFTIDKKDRITFLILGMLVIPINQVCFLNGVYMSSASHSGVLYSCTPLLAFILSIFLKHEKFSFKKIMMISITIIGIIIIFFEALMQTKLTESKILYGDILLFLAVSSWAAYLTLSKKMVDKYGAVKTSTISFIIGMVIYIPVFIFDFKNIDFNRISPTGIIAFIHLSVIVAFVGYFVFIYATKIISISTLTTMTNSSPVITIIFSYFLLQEKITYFFMIGAIITLTGVFLTQSLIGISEVKSNDKVNK